MAEVKIPLKAFRIERKCNIEGCNGELEVTGVGSSLTLAGLPTMHDHVCNVCGVHVNLPVAYPQLVHEVDNGD